MVEYLLTGKLDGQVEPSVQSSFIIPLARRMRAPALGSSTAAPVVATCRGEFLTSASTGIRLQSCARLPSSNTSHTLAGEWEHPAAVEARPSACLDEHLVGLTSWGV